MTHRGVQTVNRQEPQNFKTIKAGFPPVIARKIENLSDKTDMSQSEIIRNVVGQNLGSFEEAFLEEGEKA